MNVYRFKVQFLQSKIQKALQSRPGKRKKKKKEKEKQHLLILNSDFATPNRITKPHLMTE